MNTFSDLRETAELLTASAYKGVAGVMEFGKPADTTMLFTCMTHGNEPCGLALAQFFVQHPEIVAQLKTRVLFCVNNLEGMKRFFAARSLEEQRAARLCDINMNRLPEDQSRTDAYEVRRLVELLPIFREADIGVDIHAFRNPGPLLTIDVKGNEADIRRMSGATSMPIRVSNMVEIQDGYPLGWFFGGADRSIPVIEVECGTWQDPSSKEWAISSSLRILAALDLIDLPFTTVPSHQEIYRIVHTVAFPDLSYRLRRSHDNLGMIQKGEVIASGNGEPIIADKDYCVLFGKKKDDIARLEQIRHEVLWLTEPPVRVETEQIDLQSSLSY